MIKPSDTEDIIFIETKMKETMNEDKLLLERFGNENHFRTPEHYFDELPQRVMNRIPRKRRLRPWRWAVAAIMTGCIATAGIMLTDNRQHTETLADTDNTQYIEDILDYSMMDNTEIATYLTEAE